MNQYDIVKRLCDNNCDTYVVGGATRDMLMGHIPDDFDIVTKATPDQVVELFKDCHVKTVGKSFGVTLVNEFEVATFRHDIYEGEVCKVKFANTIHDDLSRRDLTINAMAYCEITGEIIDDHGGREDLEAKIVKFVGNPDDRILEDPCRILRACRFIAKIDGSFDAKTKTALKKHSKHLFNYKIAPERIRVEILKAMKIKNASRFFEALHEIGALGSIFPHLNSCWDHPHGNHHIENVWEHCMIAGDELSPRDPILKLTGYLHDAGKPGSYSGKPKKTFIGHEKIGANKTGIYLKQLTFTTKEIEKVSGLIRVHMNSIQKMSPKAIRKMLKRFSDRKVKVNDFLRLRMADRKANLARENFRLREWIDMVKQLTQEQEIEIPFNAHSLALSGGELIKEYGIKPGPVIGEMHQFMLDYIITHGADCNTKEHLHIVAKYYIKKYL